MDSSLAVSVGLGWELSSAGERLSREQWASWWSALEGVVERV